MRWLKGQLIWIGLLERHLEVVNIPNSIKSVRKDVSEIHFQEGLKLMVYWKSLEIGKGPAVILCYNHLDVLKFDCFGKDKGHYHVFDVSTRIYFDEESAIDQVKRSKEELRTNAEKHLSRFVETQPQSNNISVSLDQIMFVKALDQMEILMIDFIKHIDELKGI